ARAILLGCVELAGDPGPVEGEATTPTGAALVRVLSSGAPPARWRMVRSGWGAGQRNPPQYPNALRILVAEQAAEAGRVVLLATDVADLSRECAGRVKVLEQPDAGGVRVKPEYDDVLAAARALGRPPLEIARAVERDAEALVAKSKE